MELYRILEEKTKYYDYVFKSPFSIENVQKCREIKELVGWQKFCYNEKGWRFKDPALVQMIREKFPNVIIDPGIIEQVKEAELDNLHQASRADKAEQLKRGESTPLLISGLKGNLYPYQKIGVEFFVNSGGRAMLCDSPGVGKTAQALAYIVHAKKNRTLVVCPASVKFAWMSEAKKWTKLKAQVIDSRTDFRDIDYDTKIIIVNYDALKKLFNELMKMSFDCVIADESHYIKNSTAARSKAFKAIAKKSESILLLSGTPVLSRPLEIWNALTLMDPKKWVNYWDFTRRYCNGHQGQFGWEAQGATNIPELQEQISQYFLRRTKEEVLSELPPKNFIDVPVDLSKEERKQYDLAESNMLRYLKEYKKDKTPEEIAKSLMAAKLVKLNLLREINAMGKIATAKELIDSIVDAGEKVLVFSSFNAPLKELAEMYEENSVLLLGETPVEERGEIVRKFQEDPKTQIFFGGTKSAGVGITLTAASNVIHMDFPWTNADIEQATDRAHRPGAMYQSLNVYQIISRDSIDGFMLKLLKHKKRIVDQLVDGVVYDEEVQTIDGYLKSLEDKHKIK